MQAMGSPGEYYDVLRPYGVWAVISPFNFPMALSAGPSWAALVAGNTRGASSRRTWACSPG